MKKITAILTSLIMTLSVICQTSVFAAFSDVGDDNTYKDAITTLTKLKVIDGYEGGILRGHIAAGAAMGVPVGSKDISKLGI